MSYLLASDDLLKIDLAKWAEECRMFGATCAEFARDCPPPYRASLVLLAESWYRDADTIELDARILEESRLVLAQADALLKGGRRKG